MKDWFYLPILRKYLLVFIFTGCIGALVNHYWTRHQPVPSPTVVNHWARLQRYQIPITEPRLAARLLTPSPKTITEAHGPCTIEDKAVLTLQHPYLQGPFIQAVQQQLAKLGFYHGYLDGTYGPETSRAVARFQQHSGFKPTGELDLPTWLSLGEPQVSLTATQSPAQERPRGKVRLLVDLTSCTLTVYDDDRPFRRFPVAIGAPATPTPVGDWVIVQKDKWGEGFGTRWMKLSIPWGKYGIHGTNKPQSIGWPSSHGCIRMFNRDVETVYEWVTLGTPVKIIGGPLSPLDGKYPPLRVKTRGDRIFFLQLYLKEAGFYPGTPDGIFGPATERAVKEFQAAHHLPPTGVVDKATYQALGWLNFE